MYFVNITIKISYTSIFTFIQQICVASIIASEYLCGEHTLPLLLLRFSNKSCPFQAICLSFSSETFITFNWTDTFITCWNQNYLYIKLLMMLSLRYCDTYIHLGVRTAITNDAAIHISLILYDDLSFPKIFNINIFTVVFSQVQIFNSKTGP